MSYSEGDKEKQKRIFNISFILHFAIAILMGIVLLITGWFFLNGILNIAPERMYAAKVIYGSLIVSTIFTVMTVPYDAVLNARENMLYYSIVGVVESLLKFAAALVIIRAPGDKLILYGILMACIPLLTMTAMRIYCHKKYEECIIAPRKYWDKKLIIEMSRFAGWNLTGAASGMISQYGLGIVLNNFFGVILNSAQAIANQISGQLMVFSNTMMRALNPVIAKSEGGGNRSLMLTASMKGSKFAFALLAFFAIPFMIETPYILSIWLNNIPSWAILFTRLQLIRSLIEQLTVMLGVSISAQGDIKGFSVIKSILNILPIILTYLFFYNGYPPYYLYITWIVAGGILGGLVLLYFAKKKCGLNYISYFQMVVFPNLCITTLMIGIGLVPICFMDSSPYRLILVFASTSVACVLSFLLFFLTKQEKKLLCGFILMLKKKAKFI
jgi:O-antigen/teichoic acid export membrane protein